jgi:UDP-2,3-diacylglucosamine pyrophosphatase LpxH
MTFYAQTNLWQPAALLRTTFQLAHLAARGAQRLDQILQSAQELRFNDRSRMILFSDLHRGGKDANDPFVGNEGLFQHALNHYFAQGFTYIELGDGDDLWRAPTFGEIKQAYPQIFELLRQFKADDRLQLILGNHEIVGNYAPPTHKDGFPLHDGLLLRHERSNQRLFVVHGHQLDLLCGQFALISQSFARLTLQSKRWLDQQTKGLAGKLEVPGNWLQRWQAGSQTKLNDRLRNWARQRAQPLISGHTHLPAFPHLRQAPYFNTGSGIEPGQITGIEIQKGVLQLIAWARTPQGTYERQLLAAPLAL